ncbi:MAG: YkvA family protein [Geitlerinemataceae cyanobacterium]
MQNLVNSFYDWYRKTLRHPQYRWALIGATLLYLVSPIDISPDFIPVLGWIDDGAVVALLVAELSSWAIDSARSRQKDVETSAPQKSADPEVTL